MGYGFEGRGHSLIRIVAHITVTEASGGPGTGLGTQVPALNLLAPTPGGETGRHTMGRETSSVLGKYTNHSASVEQERKNSTRTKGVSVFSTRHSGKVGGGGDGGGADIVRARIGRLTWDLNGLLSLILLCIEVHWRLLTRSIP